MHDQKGGESQKVLEPLMYWHGTKKLSSRVTLLRRLVGSEWGADAKTMRTAELSLIYSTAKYCAPVLCCSAYTRFIDSVLNDALRVVIKCLRPLQRTTYPYFQASSQLSFADYEQHSPWLNVDLWTLIISCMVF